MRTMSSSAPVLVHVLATTACAAVLSATPASANALWEPRAVPSECHSANVHLLLQDISGSMAQRRLLEPALAQQAVYVMQAPVCTYVVYAEFGTTAEIVVDGFLTSDSERQRVADEIRSRPRSHQYTNFGEAAELIELVLLKVERAYARVPWSFTTSVISDHIPEPSEGGKAFDLRAYLGERQLGTRVGVLQVEIVRRGSVPTAADVRAAGGRVTASVAGLADLLQAVVIPAQPLEPSPQAAAHTDVALPILAHVPAADRESNTAEGPTVEAVDATARQSALPGGSSTLPPWIWLTGAAVLLLALLFVIFRARRAGPMLADEDEKLQVLEDRVPRALRITEQIVDDAGTVVEELRRHEEIPVAEGVPLVFSSEQGADVPIRPLAGISTDCAVSLTPQRDGQLRVHGARGLRCNAHVLPRSGLVVDMSVPLRLELEDRRWTIAPVWADVGRVEELLAAPRRPKAQVQLDMPSQAEVG